MKQKTVILLTGPTASGKTSVSLQLATQLRTEIISCDSRQCYRELNIGVAKPSVAELATVNHHFISSHSIFEEVNAASFAEYARQCVRMIFQSHDVAVMVGGTGLYIKAFTEGLDNIPEVSDDIRNAVRSAYKQHGIEWLRGEVRQQDPAFYTSGETSNPQRMMRALEVKLATGKSIREFQGQSRAAFKNFEVKKFAMNVPREQLYDNINRRVDQMMEEGLEAEARGLYSYRHLNALQTVGYSELFDYFDGKISLQAAIEKIKQNTRNYAKRQLTWFRRDPDMVWVDPSDALGLAS